MVSGAVILPVVGDDVAQPSFRYDIRAENIPEVNQCHRKPLLQVAHQVWRATSGVGSGLRQNGALSAQVAVPHAGLVQAASPQRLTHKPRAVGKHVAAHVHGVIERLGGGCRAVVRFGHEHLGLYGDHRVPARPLVDVRAGATPWDTVVSLDVALRRQWHVVRDGRVVPLHASPTDLEPLGGPAHVLPVHVADVRGARALGHELERSLTGIRIWSDVDIVGDDDWSRLRICRRSLQAYANNRRSDHRRAGNDPAHETVHPNSFLFCRWDMLAVTYIFGSFDRVAYQRLPRGSRVNIKL